MRARPLTEPFRRDHSLPKHRATLPFLWAWVPFVPLPQLELQKLPPAFFSDPPMPPRCRLIPTYQGRPTRARLSSPSPFVQCREIFSFSCGPVSNAYEECAFPNPYPDPSVPKIFYPPAFSSSMIRVHDKRQSLLLLPHFLLPPPILAFQRRRLYPSFLLRRPQVMCEPHTTSCFPRYPPPQSYP